MTGRIVQDHTGAEKTNTGQDSLDDATHRIVVGRKGAIRRPKNNHGGEGGAESHECVGPQSGRLTVQFTIQTDNGADNQSRAQAESGFCVWG